MEAKQAYIEQTGGPEVIQWKTVTLDAPGPEEVTLEQSAVGLNYIDTYHRDGTYPIELPSGLGLESVGIIRAVGDKVSDLKVGDRVGTFGPARGAYASARNLPAASLFKLPEAVSDEIAAAAMLKGFTTEFLVERCARVQSGQSVLVHAGAGGVGQLLVQWLKAIGAHVITTVGSEEKAETTRKAGADHVILYRDEDTAARVKDITDGQGVDTVFDGVGKDTWDASLKSCKRRGLIVSYGNASGPVTGIGLGALSAHGSLFVTRPTLFDYYAKPDERSAGAERLWSLIAGGKIEVSIGQRYPLDQAAQAHRDLEGRKTSGSTLLIP